MQMDEVMWKMIVPSKRNSKFEGTRVLFDDEPVEQKNESIWMWINP